MGAFCSCPQQQLADTLCRPPPLPMHPKSNDATIKRRPNTTYEIRGVLNKRIDTSTMARFDQNNDVFAANVHLRRGYIDTTVCARASPRAVRRVRPMHTLCQVWRNANASEILGMVHGRIPCTRLWRHTARLRIRWKVDRNESGDLGRSSCLSQPMRRRYHQYVGKALVAHHECGHCRLKTNTERKHLAARERPTRAPDTPPREQGGT